MCPDLESPRRLVNLSPIEEQVLLSPQRPILLTRRRPQARIAPSVAPDNPHLGVMLPYSPLHHLLMEELRFPGVPPRGNLHDEPIVTDEEEAVAILGDIADCLLVHDRPIERYVDDSVVRVQLGREVILRRARGYAPLPITLKETLPPLLAGGAHLKNTHAARDRGRPVVEVFHHHAHMASCLAENELEGEALGVTWDGAGYGEDGTIWGGEFLAGGARRYRRGATFRPFRRA